MAMNGIVSGSMREKGMDYRINFGLTLPLIKRIAQDYYPDATLSRTLRNEDVRESNILAILLFPPEEMQPEEMQEWAENIRFRELSDIACMHLFNKTPYAEKKAREWISQNNDMLQYTGFQLAGRIISEKKYISASMLNSLIEATQNAIDRNNSTTMTIALNSIIKAMHTGLDNAGIIKLSFDKWIPTHNSFRNTEAKQIIDDEYEFITESF